MELIIATIGQQILPIIGMALTALCSWGISILKAKTNVTAAQSALDQVNQVVQTVVGGLTQTVVAELKKATTGGQLTNEDAKALKQKAIDQTKALLSDSVIAAAGKTITDLESYVAQKIEEQVLLQKK